MAHERNIELWGTLLSSAVQHWSRWSLLSFTVFGQLNETLISQTPSLYVSSPTALPKVSVP